MTLFVKLWGIRFQTSEIIEPNCVCMLIDLLSPTISHLGGSHRLWRIQYVIIFRYVLKFIFNNEQIWYVVHEKYRGWIAALSFSALS